MNETTIVDANALRDLNEKLAGLVRLKSIIVALGYAEEPAVIEWLGKVETAIKTEALTLLEEPTD